MKEELRAKVHRLLKFMDKMDICNYDKSIGEQFICSESKNRDVSAHSLTREIQAIFRLDCIIDGKKFHPRKLKNSYQFPNELGSSDTVFK